MKDDQTLLYNHNQSLMAWNRLHAVGAPQCKECKAETEPWWSFCAMCGYHIAANG